MMHVSLNTGWSLRRTLLAMILTLTLSVWGFSVLVVYLDADTESQELFDQSLAETAHLLLSLADHELQEAHFMNGDVLVDAHHPEYTQYLLFQVWDRQGRLRYKNTGAPDTPLVSDNVQGYRWIQLNGHRWRSYQSWDQQRNLRILVVEPISHRKEISSRFAWKLGVFALLVLPLLSLGIWWTVNRLFRSLQQFASQVAQRHPNDLQPLQLDSAPSEIHPLLQAMNRLFGRVMQTREREQRFTADAAHELRTPLAAIKTNLQVIQRARHEHERAEAAQGLQTSVDRATRLVEQLMTLARLEPPYDKTLPKTTIDLAAWCAAQLVEWQPQAARRQQQLETGLQTATVSTDPESLRILLRNLLDNALRYTPEGGRIRLSCGEDEQHAYLEVADNGPGIPPDQQEAIFRRFVRLAPAHQHGSGLGLSIVESIAASLQTEIRLVPGLDGRGFGIRILF